MDDHLTLTPERLRSLYEAPDDFIDNSLLPDLTNVDWGKYNHAYGPATDVPALIRAALSSNERHRKFAFDLLGHSIEHQGTIYEATYYTIPFFITLLETNYIPDKSSILTLLRGIALGVPALRLDRDWQRKHYEEQGINFDKAVAKAKNDVKLTREAIQEGLNVYISLAADEDKKIRRRATFLLCAFTEQSDQILPVLLHRLETEPDNEAKYYLIKHTTTYISSTAPQVCTEQKQCIITLYHELASSVQTPRIIRFAATVAFINLIKQTDAEKTAILLNAVADPSRLHPNPHPLFTDLTVETAVDAILDLDTSQSIDYLSQALDRCTSAIHAHPQYMPIS